MLGIVAVLDRLPLAEAVADNKPERLEDISEIVTGILKTKKCPKPLMAELRGKCQYAAAQIAGRLAVGTLSGLADHQYRSLSDEISRFTEIVLQKLLDIIRNAKPRILRCSGTDKTIMAFTDGACEGEDVTIGAVVVDSARFFKPFMWGTRVHPKLVERWRAEGATQVIGQTELLPVILLKHAYRQLFEHRRIIFYIDNDSARFSLVNSYSR